MTSSSVRKHASTGPASDQPAVPEPAFAERARTLFRRVRTAGHFCRGNAVGVSKIKGAMTKCHRLPLLRQGTLSGPGEALSMEFKEGTTNGIE